MYVSVIIPHFNDAARLKLCLDALAVQDYPRDQFEVIVVDNGSEQPPRELVESYPFCRFAEEAQPGSYAARNKGLSLAKRALIAFTDSDCIPCPQWLSQGVAELQADPSVGLVAGRIEVFPADEAAPTTVELYDCVFGLPQEVNINRFHFAATANAFTRREVFDKVGVFLEGLKSGGDTEWGKRVHTAGYKQLFGEHAVVRHPARQTLKALRIQYRRHAGGRIDKRRLQSKSLVRFRDIRNVWRLVSPPIGHFRLAASRLRARGVGWLSIFRVWMITMQLNYVLLWGGIRTALGFPSERR